MALIRKIEISNFRAIKNLSWMPSPGINCLIGPGDSGKTTILNAIDFCLGARRNLQICDTDFYNLEVSSPIQISLTIGDLDDSLMTIDSYGLFLRGFDAVTGDISDEPASDLETVLTLQLIIESDLEPSWSLISERAAAQNQVRNLNWSDRLRLAPTKLGAVNEYNLSWRRGSILHRLSDERASATEALISAARGAREAFGDQAKEQLQETLEMVSEIARELGIPFGCEVKAMLDINSLSFGGATVSLHDESGVPLSGLGVGSTRLLLAGLQRCAAQNSSTVIVDELEYGLEPHRIIRLLHALGAKENPPLLQTFMTTHSPVALRELSGDQLLVVRRHGEGQISTLCVGNSDDVQGTIRLHPDAFLAASVLVCEGASEVGLVRGLDQFRVQQGKSSVTACGVAIIDGGGSSVFKRALPIQKLGYRVAVLRDSDVEPTPELEAIFKEQGGTVIAWQEDRKLEDELFISLGQKEIELLINKAIDLNDESLVNEHIKSFSSNKYDLSKVTSDLNPETRLVLARASGHKKGWFKSISAMEEVAREIVGPGFQSIEADFRERIESLFAWISSSHDS